MKRVLVLCAGNSYRSQMAEGYLKFYSKGEIDVHSAGLQETSLSPITIKVMKEDNIHMDDHQSKSLEDFRGQHFDYLITVCGDVKDETLHTIRYGRKLHYDVPDPAAAGGSEEEVEQEFFRVRELIKKSMLKFLGGMLSENPKTA